MRYARYWREARLPRSGRRARVEKAAAGPERGRFTGAADRTPLLRGGHEEALPAVAIRREGPLRMSRCRVAPFAPLDRPFVIERPDELRGLAMALADRLASCARPA